MPYSLTINGFPYPLPLQSERMWAEQVNSFFDALSKHLLQKTGGVFTLGAEVDFGTGHGAAIKYIKSKTSSNLSQRGFLLLDKGDLIGWRNNANTADILSGINSADRGVIGTPTAFSAVAGSDTFTSVGRVPLVGEAVQLVSFTGTGLAVGGIYYATNVSGLTFQLYGTPGGPVLADVTADGTGIFIILDPMVSTGSVDTLRNKTLFDLSYDSETATLSSGSISPSVGRVVQRLSFGTGNIEMIAAPSSGKVYVLVNETGSDRTIKNDTGATAANRIYTGSGADLTLKNQAAVTLIYNAGLSRWVVAGGSGGGGLAPNTQSTSFTAAPGNNYLVNTSSGPVTATLPAGTTGATIRFVDNTESWGINNLTITPASGEAIDMLAANETLVCDVVRGWVELSWDGTRWAFSSLASTTVGVATASSSGIVSTGTQTFAGNKTFNGSITPSGGIVGKTDGAAVPAGNTGQVVEAVSGLINLTGNGQYTDVASITLPAGVWLVNAVAVAALNTGTGMTVFYGAIGTVAGNNNTGVVYGSNQFDCPPPTAAYNVSVSIPGIYLNLSSSQTYYLKGLATYSGGTPQSRGRITAVRIA